MPVFQTINTLSNTTSTSTNQDVTQPYSYKDWLARNINVTPGNAFSQYESYVRSWYIDNAVANQTAVNAVQNYYINFLQTLGITARTPYEQQLFGNVNFTNNLSIQAAITGFARRLKDVAVYIANTRNNIVYSKLKNNMIGTALSLERLFYNYVLTAFTRKISTDGKIITSFVITDPNILSSLPYINVIASSFSIEIVELYDTNNYFDQDPTMPVSTYTAIASGIPAPLYTSGQYSSPESYLITNALASLAIYSASTSTTMITTTSYFVFTGDGVTTTFQLNGIANAIASNYQVTIDGLVQVPDTSYSVSAQNQTITFSSPPPISTTIVIL